MIDDVQRRARRAARIATYRDSEDRHRRALAIPPTRTATLDELLVGAQPLDGSPIEDARSWAREVLHTPAAPSFPDELHIAISRFGLEPTAARAVAVERAALAQVQAVFPDLTAEDSFGDVADRATIYAALLGDPEAAGRAVAIVHYYLFGHLHTGRHDPVPLREVFVTLLHVCSLCSRDLPAQPVANDLQADWRMGRGSARQLLEAIADVAVPPEELPAPAAPVAPLAPAPTAGAAGEGDLDLDLGGILGRAYAPSLVVIPEPTGKKKVPGQAAAIVGRALPLRPMPDLEALGRHLVERSPWAAPGIARLIGLLQGRAHAGFPNIVFVGPPGAGKSELARDFVDALGVPSLVYACAGAHDGSIGGTSKQWSSARPAVWTQIPIEHECANGVLILDELDKAAPGGGHNGSVREALLGIAEPSQRKAFWDVGLETKCDLSGISLLATANSVEPMRGPLLDRFVRVEIGAPRRQDLPVVIRTVLEGMRAEVADARWIPDLDGVEFEALRRAWKGGSLRPLRRAIERIIGARADRRFSH
ncbi:AAA family ATPase [Methylorubrum rhodesianum]|uniref:AAA family ATPase n=1 Tax=Methylorubrum rhodesianum TaxID=29427 RepID=UPI003D2DC653